MTNCFRRRPAEIEAVQWTGSNTDQMRAFAGIDFDTIAPEDRIDDPDQDAQLLSEDSHWVGIKPGEWVLKFDGYFIAKSDDAFRTVWEPAAPAVVEPPADQTALRDRIADVIRKFPFDDFGLNDVAYFLDSTPDTQEWVPKLADAVLAVLPEPADRTGAQAAALRWAADHIEDGELLPTRDLKFVRGVDWALGRLRRMADETAPDETDAAQAAVSRVRILHRKANHGETCVYCAHGQRLGYDTTWPCDTIRALDGTDQPAAGARQESCAHCGQPIRRITGTLAVWWVHDPGGNTVCDWAQPAHSPRATPKTDDGPADGVRQDGATQ